jgi:hypothetical protein
MRRATCSEVCAELDFEENSYYTSTNSFNARIQRANMITEIKATLQYAKMAGVPRRATFGNTPKASHGPIVLSRRPLSRRILVAGAAIGEETRLCHTQAFLARLSSLHGRKARPHVGVHPSPLAKGGRRC